MPEFELPRLRSVKKADLPAIAKLEEIAFGGHGLSHGALDVFYDTSGSLWLLAEDGEGVWGYAINVRGEDPRMGWIVGMAIHPDRRGRGWSKHLLEAAIYGLRRRDIDVIRLLVDPLNKVARRLYEDFGFLDTGARVDHFGPGEPRMVLSLLPPQQAHRPDHMPAPQVPCDEPGHHF